MAGSLANGDDRNAEIRRVWRGKLRPVGAESLNPALPPRVLEFLQEVGLPTENCWNVIFHDLPSWWTRHVDGRDMIMFGSDHGTPIAVDAVGESVWAVTPGVPEALTFYNSSLPAYLHAFGRLDATLTAIVTSSPTESRELINGLRVEFAKLDPPSMRLAGGGWPNYLDRLEEELE